MVLAKRGFVVFSVIKIVTSPKQRAQVLEILQSVADLTWPTPGCTGCCVSEEDTLQKPIRYTEQWESEEALYSHIRSELYRRLLSALELSKKEPEVKFYFASQTKGFELVEAIRNSSSAETNCEHSNEPGGSGESKPDLSQRAALEHIARAPNGSH